MSKEFSLNKTLEKQMIRTLSSLLAGWVWVSRMSLEEISSLSGVTRSNLHYQTNDPENSKRMGLKTLVRTTSLAGLRIGLDGSASLFNGISQHWTWNQKSEEKKERVRDFFFGLHHILGSNRNFVFSQVSFPSSAWISDKNISMAVIEIFDAQGTVMRAVLRTTPSYMESVKLLIKPTGIFDFSENIVISTENAIQMMHGVTGSDFHDPISCVDWNQWIPMCVDLAKRGYRTNEVDAATKLPAILPFKD